MLAISSTSVHRLSGYVLVEDEGQRERKVEYREALRTECKWQNLNGVPGERLGEHRTLAGISRDTHETMSGVNAICQDGGVSKSDTRALHGRDIRRLVGRSQQNSPPFRSDWLLTESIEQDCGLYDPGTQ